MPLFITLITISLFFTSLFNLFSLYIFLANIESVELFIASKIENLEFVSLKKTTIYGKSKVKNKLLVIADAYLKV